MFALFDHSKAAEALSVHGHAACTCSGRSRGQMVGGPTSHVLATLLRDTISESGHGGENF